MAVGVDYSRVQFERAEYVGGTLGPACCTCKQPATPQYHQFNGRVFCTNCRQQIEQSIQQLHQSGSMAQAALFGLARRRCRRGLSMRLRRSHGGFNSA